MLENLALSCHVRKRPSLCLTRRLITVFEILDLWILSRTAAVNFESTRPMFLRPCFISFFCPCLSLKRGPLPSGLDAPVRSYYLFRPSHCTWFYYYNNVQYVTEIMKVIIVQIFETPFLLPHQTLVLKTFVLCFSLDMRGQIFTQTQNSRQDYSFICFNI